MTLITPEERVSRTAELVQSLQNSISELRHQIEDLKRQIAAGEEVELAGGIRQVAAADGLVRTCQKMEASLVEQYNRQIGIVQGGYALDLERARSEIGCRLARLRRCCGAGDVSE
ncbi:MAG: hypothetical protein NXH82_08080 [Rhodobacteraceae bacterium]|nr:hypothetical protein [Paracoccaceae bacterium]